MRHLYQSLPWSRLRVNCLMVAAPKSPEPVTLIIGMLSSESRIFDDAEQELVRLYGPVDLSSDIIDFDYTNYYEKEMGSNIKRKFLSFRDKIDPGKLAEIKLQTNDLEVTFSKRKSFMPRPINIDPGYVSRSKLILASTKNYAHRIYLNRGIYAEITLLFRNKKFIALESTYPDYRSEEYIEFFTRVRGRHVAFVKLLQT